MSKNLRRHYSKLKIYVWQISKIFVCEIGTQHHYLLGKDKPTVR